MKQTEFRADTFNSTCAPPKNSNPIHTYTPFSHQVLSFQTISGANFVDVINPDDPPYLINSKDEIKAPEKKLKLMTFDKF